MAKTRRFKNKRVNKSKKYRRHGKKYKRKTFKRRKQKKGGASASKYPREMKCIEPRRGIANNRCTRFLYKSTGTSNPPFDYANTYFPTNREDNDNIIPKVHPKANKKHVSLYLLINSGNPSYQLEVTDIKRILNISDANYGDNTFFPYIPIYNDQINITIDDVQELEQVLEQELYPGLNTFNYIIHFLLKFETFDDIKESYKMANPQTFSLFNRRATEDDQSIWNDDKFSDLKKVMKNITGRYQTLPQRDSWLLNILNKLYAGKTMKITETFNDGENTLHTLHTFEIKNFEEYIEPQSPNAIDPVRDLRRDSAKITALKINYTDYVKTTNTDDTPTP